MKKIIISLIILIISISCYCQEHIAKDILENLRKKTQTYQNITINFDLNYIWGDSEITNKKQISNTKSGTLTSQEDKFILEFDNQIIINNGKTQWIYLSDMNEVQIVNSDTDNSLISPNKLLTIYEKDYKYNYVGSETEGSKYLQIIDLFPKESTEFIKITIAIDSSKNVLDKIILKDKSGGKYIYLIKSFKSNTKTKTFNFNIEDFPGIEVIDLR